MANTQYKTDELLSEIAELRKKFAEIEGKNAELEVENAKLRQVIDKNSKCDARVGELEQKNIELENRLAILEQGEKSISTDVSHSPVNFNDTHEQIISRNEESNTYSHSVTVSDNSDICQNPVIPAEIISLEEKEENVFLNSKYRETVRKEIIQNIKKKKLQDQESLTTLSEEERPQDLNSDAQSRNSTSSEASANSDGSKLPPKGKIYSEVNSKCKKKKLPLVTDSNLESSDDEKSYDGDTNNNGDIDVNQLPVENFFDDDSQSEDANATRDNKNDDKFYDNNEEEDDDEEYCSFSDDDEGYYYDLST
ncbi:4799_t:CDS:2, partial [Ambispora gerdemannii]